MMINLHSLSSRTGDEIKTDSLESKLGLDKGFIARKTGIEALKRFEGDEAFMGACEGSIRSTLQIADLSLQDIDGIFAVNNSTAYIAPTLSVRMVERLGLSDLLTQDVGLGCAGGLQAMQAGYNQLLGDTMRGKQRNYILLVADNISQHINKNDYKTNILFSDGVASAVMTNDEVSEGWRVNSVDSRSQGGGSSYALQMKSPSHQDYSGMFWEMNGGEVFRFGVDAFSKGLDLLEKSIEDFDRIIPHQSNLKMLEKISSKYGLSQNQLYTAGVCLQGNTSSASTFYGLQQEKEARNVALVAFGANLAYAAADLTRL